MEQLPDNYTLADRELIQRAYRMAEEAHSGQKRHSGEPYISHCLAVASILADLRVPPDVVAAGLLHDTVEDTHITLNDIRRDFGGTVAVLVDGVTKLTNLPRVSRDDQHAENSNGHNGSQPSPALHQELSLGRKQDLVSETPAQTFLAMGDDVRVVIIKLADRLHNMRTLGLHARARTASGSPRRPWISLPPSPTALGIWQIKWGARKTWGFRPSQSRKNTKEFRGTKFRKPPPEAPKPKFETLPGLIFPNLVGRPQIFRAKK